VRRREVNVLGRHYTHSLLIAPHPYAGLRVSPPRNLGGGLAELRRLGQSGVVKHSFGSTNESSRRGRGGLVELVSRS
jgi:hypothetical protein